MYRGVVITPPFFEIGPKAYSFGPEMLDIALHADRLSRDYGVQIIIDPQYVDIPVIAARARRALVFAQHMDFLDPGRGQGSVLPESLRAAGASGVVLNHVERRLLPTELERTIRRADAVGLATMVAADDVESAVALAALAPNIIVVESPDVIGTGAGTGRSPTAVAACNQAIWAVNPDIRVLHGGGIGSARDVFEAMAAGAQGSGSSSGVFLAPDPKRALEEMVRAAREGWDAHVERGDRGGEVADRTPVGG